MSKENKENNIREFDSGATRDTSDGKLEYFGFIHPLNDFSFAKYMNTKRDMPDGSKRDSNNWQLGIPTEVYMQSLVRHIEDLKLLEQGYTLIEYKENNKVKKEVLKDFGDISFALEMLDIDDWDLITKEDTLNAIRFNSEGMKLNLIGESEPIKMIIPLED